MACFIRPHAIPSHHNNNANFTPFNPLLSFLEDFATQFQPENATTTPAHRQQRATSSSTKKTEKPTPSYTPRFDIVEHDTAYELYGELPGVKVEDINVEFSDEKTLTISGSSTRFTAISDVVTPAATAVADTIPAAETASQKGKERQAAVEDVDDFEDLSTTSRAATPDSTTAPDPETQLPDELETATAAAAQPQSSTETEHKFVLSERKYGKFSRTFQFPVPVEKEEVSARLRDGVLVVQVPKRVIRSQKVRVSID